MTKLSESLTAKDVLALETTRKRAPSLDKETPVMVFAKAFVVISTGETFYLKFAGFGGTNDKDVVFGQNRNCGPQQPSRFLGDVLVDEAHSKGWDGDPARRVPAPTVFLPYGIETVIN